MHEQFSIIASGLRALANQFEALAKPQAIPESKPADPKQETIKSVGEHLAETLAKDPKKKAKAEKAAEPKTVDAVADPAGPAPEQIANELKAKLITFAGKDRAKAIAILAAVGAKKFSDIPVAKHGEILLQVNKALGAAEEAEVDPFSN